MNATVTVSSQPRFILTSSQHADLLAWMTRALELIRDLCLSHRVVVAVSTCSADLADILQRLDPASSPNWDAVLADLDAWESAYRPLLVVFPLRRFHYSPAAELRAILDGEP
jgi:hypothetical protein